MKKYNVHKTTTFLSKSGRLPKISDKEVITCQDWYRSTPTLVYINQRSHVLSRRVLQLKYLLEEKLRSIKMKTKNTELNQILGHYKILKPDVQLILDDEKYFSLNGDISCNRKYYTTDRSTAPSEVKFKIKMKFEPNLLVWMAVSQKSIASIYVHRSTIAIKQETYLHDYIRKRLSIIITRMTMFYFSQILLHHITQNKFKNFSKQIIPKDGSA